MVGPLGRHPFEAGRKTWDRSVIGGRVPTGVADAGATVCWGDAGMVPGVSDADSEGGAGDEGIGDGRKAGTEHAQTVVASATATSLRIASA